MTRLVFAPHGQLFEAPASWVSRVALSQGAKLREVLRLLQVSGPDLDLELMRPEISAACRPLGLDPERLSVANRVFANLRRANLDPERFLLFEGKSPRYRFCPLCLTAGGVPTIPVHWRFSCWRVCPVHACLMRDECGNCGSTLSLPASMVDAGPKQDGIAYLSMCLTCGSPLSATPSVHIDDIGLQDWEFDLVGNGRAVLAALYFGGVLMTIDGQRQSLGRLGQLEQHGMLPNKSAFLRRERIAERVAYAASRVE